MVHTLKTIKLKLHPLADCRHSILTHFRSGQGFDPQKHGQGLRAAIVHGSAATRARPLPAPRCTRSLQRALCLAQSLRHRLHAPPPKRRSHVLEQRARARARARARLHALTSSSSRATFPDFPNISASTGSPQDVGRRHGSGGLLAGK
jgi:hypothetical protein